MKILIVSSGNIKKYEEIKYQFENSNFIICADGGISHLRKIKKIPNIVLGDLDSINEYDKNYIKENKIKIEKYPVMKDSTDTELAVEYAKSYSPKEIIMMGVTGSRLDHTLGNISLLKSIHMKKIKGKIIDDNNTIYYENNQKIIPKRENKYLSIIPLSLEGGTISLEGFLYPLNKYHIKYGSTIGISNEIIEKQGIINIHNGEFLIIESKD